MSLAFEATTFSSGGTKIEWLEKNCRPETEMNNSTTDAPSTAGSSQDIYKIRSDFRNPSHGLRS